MTEQENAKEVEGSALKRDRDELAAAVARAEKAQALVAAGVRYLEELAIKAEHTETINAAYCALRELGRGPLADTQADKPEVSPPVVTNGRLPDLCPPRPVPASYVWDSNDGLEVLDTIEEMEQRKRSWVECIEAEAAEVPEDIAEENPTLAYGQIAKGGVLQWDAKRGCVVDTPDGSAPIGVTQESRKAWEAGYNRALKDVADPEHSITTEKPPRHLDYILEGAMIFWLSQTDTLEHPPNWVNWAQEALGEERVESLITQHYRGDGAAPDTSYDRASASDRCHYCAHWAEGMARPRTSPTKREPVPCPACGLPLLPYYRDGFGGRTYISPIDAEEYAEFKAHAAAAEKGSE